MSRCSSSTQKIQGLSSGESEFLALVRGGSIDLGAKGDGRRLWAAVPGLDLETDSSAAKDVATRRGVGKTRHPLPTVMVAAACDEGLGMRPTSAHSL